MGGGIREGGGERVREREQERERERERQGGRYYKLTYNT